MLLAYRLFEEDRGFSVTGLRGFERLGNMYRPPYGVTRSADRFSVKQLEATVGVTLFAAAAPMLSGKRYGYIPYPNPQSQHRRRTRKSPRLGDLATI